MALRDHSLDDRIAAAAREEFADKGFMGASLRRIAQSAGVTVGAIQTRYRSKDELFVSLLTPLLENIQAAFQSIRGDYYSSEGEALLAHLKTSMERESAVILRLIFDHYEEATLLFRGSTGSSLEHYFDRLVQSKVEESISFFRSAGFAVDERLLGLLICVQFDSYRRIVTGCPDWQSAESSMNSLMTYHLGGWAALFGSTGGNE